ncbi:MAG: glutathione S-transferase family protein [Geminicoccaceae bacterium]
MTNLSAAKPSPLPRLVSHLLCPYVQRAMITLAEKGVAFERVDVDLAAKPAWFLAISPLGRVPLLQVGDAVLFESAAIVEYLDETMPGPRLHPDDPLERARHRGWIEFGSATLADIAGLYGAADEPAFAARCSSLRSRFARLEEALGDGPWFAGAKFSFVDAVFGPVFRYFDVIERSVDLGVLDGLPKCRAWRIQLARRPSVAAAVAADYPERLQAFLLARRSWLSGLLGGAAAERAA